MDEKTKKELEKQILKYASKDWLLEREATLAWDGSNIMLRLPKDIADNLGVNKDNRFSKSIRFSIASNKGVVEKFFDVVKRTKPRKKDGNKKKL